MVAASELKRRPTVPIRCGFKRDRRQPVRAERADHAPVPKHLNEVREVVIPIRAEHVAAGSDTIRPADGSSPQGVNQIGDLGRPAPRRRHSALIAGRVDDVRVARLTDCVHAVLSAVGL
ncbi:hypothetical protein D3C81_1808540 [compost metagenome]